MNVRLAALAVAAPSGASVERAADTPFAAAHASVARVSAAVTGSATGTEEKSKVPSNGVWRTYPSSLTLNRGGPTR
jgi:hypothetical protein